jgi:hypothetical protein
LLLRYKERNINCSILLDYILNFINQELKSYKSNEKWINILYKNYSFFEPKITNEVKDFIEQEIDLINKK